MKKLILFLLLLALAIPKKASGVVIDGLYYDLNSSKKTAELTYQSTGTSNYTGKINVVVPEKITYNGAEYTVTSIGNNAFANCTSLESISIPGTVTTIGSTVVYSSTSSSSDKFYKNAGKSLPFYNCTNLKRVRFEDSSSTVSLGVAYVGYVSSISDLNQEQYYKYSKGLFYYCPLEELYMGRNITYTNYDSSTTDKTISSFSYHPYYYGYSAFYNQTKLKGVTIGDKVSSLPQYTFYHCSGLTNLEIGNSLKSISSHAFDGCTALSAVIIPSATSTVDSYAFNNCTGLKTVSLPEVTSIEANAFYNNSSLSALELSPVLKKIGNYAFYNTTALKSVTLSSTLTEIGNYSFYKSGITDIVIPSSVTTIGESCFYGTNLKRVYFGDTNIKLGTSAFANSTITDVTVGAGQKEIPASCFENCLSLKDITLNEGLTSIGNKAFANCTSLESISIPGTVTTLGNTVVYSSTSSSSDLYYQNAGKSLPFYNCTNLKRVRFEDGSSTVSLGVGYVGYVSSISDLNQEQYYKYSKGLFYYCPLEELYLGRNITYKNYEASTTNKAISSFSSNPYYYGYSAFYNQTKLTNITVGDKISSISQYLFYGCTNIKNIVSFRLTPPTVETNGFSNYNATLYYLANATSYGTTTPWNKFTQFTIYTNGNLMFIPTSETDAMVAKTFNAYPESISIPETINSYGKTLKVTKIMEGAFAACENLTNVSLPPSITEIGEGAFARNEKLASITFNGQKIIGKNAFSGCTSITTLTLPVTLEEIRDGAFYKNTSLSQVSFGSSLKTIGNEAFMSCGVLTAARMPNTLINIGASAFEDCVKLTNVSVGSSLKTLGGRAFFNCKVLSDIEIPGTTTTVGDQAFENCSDLVLVTLNSGTITLGAKCFKNCDNLTSISIPGTVTSIGEWAFDECTKLSTLSFLAGEKELRIPSFKDCPIRTLRIGRNLKYSYGDLSSPFRNNTTLNRVSFTGNYVTNLYNNLFDGCSGITSIELPSTLKTINSSVFKNCYGLSEALIPEGVTNIGDNCFENCEALTSISLPSTLVGIANSLFKNCISLQTIDLKEGLKWINSYAFDKCSNLEGLTIPSTVTSIESYGFEGCISFKKLVFTDSKEEITIGAAGSLFRDCPLETLYIGRNITYTYNSSTNVPFYNKSTLKSVVFGTNPALTTIPDYLIYGASNVKSIEMPDNVTSAGKYAFTYCSAMESIQLSNSLQSIEEGLLRYCSALKSLVIPASVQTVNNYALGGCTALAELRINDSGKTLTASKSASSKGMCAEAPLENLYIGRNITYIADSSNGYSPFYGLSSLKTVTFNMVGNINNLGDYYFGKCSSVKNLDLPQSIVSIGQYGLYDMSSLENLTFPQKVSVLRNNLMDGCRTLPNFTVYKAVTSIEENVFNGCIVLSDLIIENGNGYLNVARKNVSNTYASLFVDCPIKTLHLGRWLNYEIGQEHWAPFYGQSTLVNLTLGETLGDIGKFLFENCISLEKVNIPGVESIGQKAFFGCSKLKNVTFNTGIKSLGEYSFSECVSLDNVELPSTVVSISEGSFMNCQSLTTVQMNEPLEIIGPSAFAGCVNLKFADIPESVYGLGVESFKRCISLPYINIPKGLTSVGASAFQGCSGAEWLILSQRCGALGTNSFEGCSSIKYIKSFNTNPPVGLPGFDRKLYETATVFAPDDFVEDYAYSDVWWEFYDIRPISGAVPVESIYLTNAEASLKVTENIKIEPIINPGDAFCKTLGYFSTDPDIATVDDEGVVTGVSLGETEIVLFSKDGSGIKQTFKVKVIPTLMERITLSTQSLTLRPNRQNTLTATVYPPTTTNQEIKWTSSRPEVATVDGEGNITTVFDGETTIKAEAVDGSGTVAMCVVSVIPPMSGDSNDNDEVTISDAVNTANYAVGKTVENFNARAADVNGDNNVTLADASGTVSIVLAQDNSAAPIRSLLKALSNDMARDMLVIDDFNVAAGETVSLDVRLDNSIEYVAMQADINVPEGMTLENVAIGGRADIYHKLLTRRIDERTIRIALFDISNHSFAENDEPLLKITVRQNSAAMPSVKINNILASDASANEYSLEAVGGEGIGTSGVSQAVTDNVRIETTNGCINIYNTKGKNIHIFSINGSLIARATGAHDKESFNVLPGVYVAIVDNSTYKVIVK